MVDSPKNLQPTKVHSGILLHPPIRDAEKLVRVGFAPTAKANATSSAWKQVRVRHRR
jgi:hypothetical protein